MNASRTTTVQETKAAPNDDNRPGFRSKTISTRLPPEELAEVEAAAERAGQPLSEWLRETALRAARERPAEPLELLLAEIWAVRHVVLGLFHAGAQATAEGKPLLPESVIKVRDKADREKLEQARQMLADFLSHQAEEGGKPR